MRLNNLRRRVERGLFVLTAGLAVSVPAWAFECSTPQKLARAGVLKESQT